MRRGREALPQDIDGGGRKRPRDTALTLSASLLTLDRQSLSLVLQQLPWGHKLLEASHLCRALAALDSADFRCDGVILGSKIGHN